MDFDNNKIVINGKEIGLEFASRYNVYNLCSAFAVCSVIGVDEELISRSLNDFIMKNGRVVRFRAGDNEGILITSKHENSTSYNQSLEYVASVKENSELFLYHNIIFFISYFLSWKIIRRTRNTSHPDNTNTPDFFFVRQKRYGCLLLLYFYILYFYILYFYILYFYTVLSLYRLIPNNPRHKTKRHFPEKK